MTEMLHWFLKTLVLLILTTQVAYANFFPFIKCGGRGDGDERTFCRLCLSDSSEGQTQFCSKEYSTNPKSGEEKAKFKVLREI